MRFILKLKTILSEFAFNYVIITLRSSKRYSPPPPRQNEATVCFCMIFRFILTSRNVKSETYLPTWSINALCCLTAGRNGHTYNFWNGSWITATTLYPRLLVQQGLRVICRTIILKWQLDLLHLVCSKLPLQQWEGTYLYVRGQPFQK